MSFCTSVHCIDGRVQIPVINYLKQRFNVKFVDSVTEPGPNLILAKRTNPVVVGTIFERIRISIEAHNSVGIAVVGHYDCAGNHGSPEQQAVHTGDAIHTIKQKFPNTKIIGLWVDEHLNVREIF